MLRLKTNISAFSWCKYKVGMSADGFLWELWSPVSCLCLDTACFLFWIIWCLEVTTATTVSLLILTDVMHKHGWIFGVVVSVLDKDLTINRSLLYAHFILIVLNNIFCSLKADEVQTRSVIMSPVAHVWITYRCLWYCIWWTRWDLECLMYTVCSVLLLCFTF